MTGVDLAPLRRLRLQLCQDAMAQGTDASEWPGWFRWVPSRTGEDGAVTFPTVAYGPKMDLLWKAFESAGWHQEPFDWMKWLASCRDPFSPRTIGLSGLEGLSGLLYAIRREQRFCEGHWVACLKDQTFVHIADRWLDEMGYRRIVQDA